jgi:hypothetical protein
MRNYLSYVFLFMFFTSCNLHETKKQTSEADTIVKKDENIFRTNGVQPLLEKELRNIFKEDSFGDWPVYMVFLNRKDTNDYIFIVGSLSYLPNDIQGGFVYDGTLLVFYKIPPYGDSFPYIIDFNKLDNLTTEALEYYGGDPNIPWPIFHETFHKFEIKADTLLLLKKGRLKDEIPFYDFSAIRGHKTGR